MEKRERQFPVRKSPTVVLISVLMVILMGVAFVVLSKSGLRGGLDSLGLKIVWGLLIPALIVPLLYMPVLVTLTAHSLRLRVVCRTIEIPLSEIVTIEPRKESISRDIRLFGSGGYGGFIGKYRNSERGYYTAYAGDAKEMFWVQTSSRLYCLSCSDSLQLIALVQKFKTDENKEGSRLVKFVFTQFFE